MNGVAEIKGALATLSNEELRDVEASVLEHLRARKVGILYDDAYGVWTEDDQASVAAEAFDLIDQSEGN